MSKAATKKEDSAVVPAKPQRTLQDWFKEHAHKFSAVAPKEFDVNRMFFLYQQSISRNPRLAECTASSLLSAFMKCSELGLEPNSGLNHATILPFRNSSNNSTEAQFIPGYKGLMKLAPDVKFDAVAVFEDEVKAHAFTVQQGTDPKIIHTPLVVCDRSPEKLMAVYAIAFYPDGSFVFDWMTREDVFAIKKRSKSANSGPWVTDYIAMALKSVLRRLCWRKLELDPNSKLAKALTYDDDEGPGRFELDPGKEIKPGANRVQTMLDNAQGGNGKHKEEQTPEIQDAQEAGENQDGNQDSETNHKQASGTPTIEDVIAIANRLQKESKGIKFTKACKALDLSAGDVLTKRIELNDDQISKLIDLLNAE